MSIATARKATCTSVVLGLLVACAPEAHDVVAGTTSSAGESSSTKTEGSSASSTTAPASTSSDAASTGGTASDASTDTTDTTGSAGGERIVLYLNTEGATLTVGEGFDARNDEVAAEEFAGTWPPYEGDTEALAAVVRGHWMPFDVTVTTERPESGDYTMIVVTSAPSPFPPAPSLAPPGDCLNTNPNDIALVFHDGGTVPPDNDNYWANVTGSITGITLGLEFHDADPSDLMRFAQDLQPASFRDECFPLFDRPMCPRQHEASCNNLPDVQNSYQELLQLLGAAP